VFLNYFSHVYFYILTHAVVSGDTLLPVQGILEVNSRKLTLLSTPLTSQFIALKAVNRSVSDKTSLKVETMSSRRLQLFKQSTKVLETNFTGSGTLNKIFGTDVSRATSLKATSNITNDGNLFTYFGPNMKEVELSRIDISKIFSGKAAEGV
jgi:hypothetical protein